MNVFEKVIRWIQINCSDKFRECPYCNSLNFRSDRYCVDCDKNMDSSEARKRGCERQEGKRR